MRRPIRSALMLALLVALLPSAAAAVGVTWSEGPTLTATGMEDTSGVAVDKWGNVYVACELRNSIFRFGSSGAYVGSWGTTGTGSGQLNGPRSVACDRWGRVYVADRQNDRISAFWPGIVPAESSSIGTAGSNPWNTSNPLGVSVGLDGDVYVINNMEYVIRFGSDGALEDYWPLDGPGIGIDVDQDGRVWVANDQAGPIDYANGNRIMRYSPDGTVLASFGGTDTAPPTDGLFRRSYDVSVDGAGRIMVAESEGNRVQVFDGNATFQSDFGTGVLSLPYSVAAGFDRVAYAADTFSHTVTTWESSPTISTVETAVAGGNRFATAAAASAKAYPDGSDWVVIASGANWPDALGGASLCGALDAPLLLTAPTSLSPEALAEITRLGATGAYVLGGTGAVTDDVLSDVEDAVHSDVVRLGGANRYATAALIASETISVIGSENYSGTAFVCTGKAFPDALSVAPIAAANVWPIYLTEPTTYTAATRDGMLANAAQHGYVIGGEGAVSQDVVDAIEDASPLPFDGFSRYAGANRYSTAAAVAQAGFDGMGMLWSRPALTSGVNFPDALAGGVLQGSDYGVMLLTSPYGLDASATAALEDNREMIYEMRFIGGTAAVPGAVRDDAMDLLL